MSVMVRYAILDTDFTSKANIVKTERGTLADEVFSFPDYRFFCHQKMREELENHGTNEAKEWLDCKIETGEIGLYDDKRILHELYEKVGKNCYGYYRSFLKSGCDMFRATYYTDYFKRLDERINAGICDEDEFVAVLRRCEDSVGHQNNYGEIKAFVLVRTLEFLYNAEICVFCSDDFDARQGFANIEQIPCISILAVFQKLKTMGRTYDAVLPLYQSFVDWRIMRNEPHDSVKIWCFQDGTLKRVRVAIDGLLEDIYAGKYEVMKNGDLKQKA